MEKIFLKENLAIKDDIESLYNSAFPINERPPFDYFYKVFARTNDSHIIGYYQDNQFVGFIHYVIYKDIIYIAYLAVKMDMRNMGYGSQILHDIRQIYPDYTILLCFEEVEPTYLDYPNRVNRQSFYKRNGYIDNGLKTQEGDVIYQSAYNGFHRVNYQNYQQLFDLVYGYGASNNYLKLVKEY